MAQPILLKTALAALIALPASIALAGYNGDVSFSPNEIDRHLQDLPQLIETTKNSMKAHAELQHRWVDACGIGLLYGFKSSYAKLGDAQRAYYIDANTNRRCPTKPRVADIKITSCEIHTNRHLELGFDAIGQRDVYKRIHTFFKANGRDGLALAYALRKLGWKIVYWNTDTKKAPKLPADRKLIGHNQGDHVYVQGVALKKKVYVGDPGHPVPIDGFLLDFSPHRGSPIEKRPNLADLAKFKSVPYFIGVAHGGFHVWPGYDGIVNESHSPYEPTRKKNIEVNAFGPPTGAPMGFGVEELNYHSGIIAIPPGPWVWF